MINIIENDIFICQLCGENVNLNYSFNMDHFSVCSHCFNKLVQQFEGDTKKVFQILFNISQLY